jgi:hypothetical protein
MQVRDLVFADFPMPEAVPEVRDTAGRSYQWLERGVVQLASTLLNASQFLQDVRMEEGSDVGEHASRCMMVCACQQLVLRLGIPFCSSDVLEDRQLNAQVLFKGFKHSEAYPKKLRHNEFEYQIR